MKQQQKKQNGKPETMVGRLTRLVDAEEKRMTSEKDAGARQTTVRTIAMLCAELRKAEAAARRDSDDISKALVVEWFRQLDQTEQQRFLRELQTIGTKRSGLA